MLGILGLLIVAITGWLWIQLIRNVAVPRQRTPYLLGFAAGALLGVAAIARGEGFLSTAAGILAAIAGTLFVLLRLQSAQKPNTPAVSVGGPILDFSAPDEHGTPFELASLAGKPYLLKFFRGHW